MNNEIVSYQPNIASFAVLELDRLELNEGQLEGLPSNPREIEDKKFDLLKENIKKYPHFLQYNMLKVYNINNTDKYIIIGGNMRFRALRELGFKAAPCAIISPDTSIEELKAYTILDNNSFGRYEWASLANEWDEAQLQSWGTDLPIMESEINVDDFFDNLNDDGSKDKGEKITIHIPLELESDKEQIKSIVESALADYSGITIK
jgi:hypothetical protein